MRGHILYTCRDTFYIPVGTHFVVLPVDDIEVHCHNTIWLY